MKKYELLIKIQVEAESKSDAIAILGKKNFDEAARVMWDMRKAHDIHIRRFDVTEVK